MSQIIFSAIVLLLVPHLNAWGLQIGSEQLTNALQTIASIMAFAWLAFKRKQMGGKTASRINVFGWKNK